MKSYTPRPSQEIAKAIIARARASHSRATPQPLAVAPMTAQMTAQYRAEHSIWQSLFAPVMDSAIGNDPRVPHYEHMLVRTPSSMSLEHGRRDCVEMIMEVAYWDSLLGVRSLSGDLR